MIPNVKPSQVYPVKGSIDPQSIAAAGNAASGWVDVSSGAGFVSVEVNTGALGGGTLSVDILQATDGSGTGSAALTTGALTGINAALQGTNGKVFVYEFRPDDVLDTNSAFKFIQAKVNNVGGTGALVSAQVRVGPARFMA